MDTSSIYKPAIGLEVHVELKTKTKMFCDSPNNPNELRPNVNVCPVCMGHPGTLPTINKEAILCVLRVGRALGANLQAKSHFDRKSYFYPDIPKGYQISQYKSPLVLGGELAGISIRRIHLEEDTGKLIHDDTDKTSLVDYNRAGVPLMELVTEPVIHSGREAKKFAEELQKILRYLRVSSADMEKGHMRLEANISVKKLGDNEHEDVSRALAPSPQDSRLGTKVEVKNLNSFRSTENAIDYEIDRHIKVLEDGGKVVQETRGWNEVKSETFSQREKEEAHDYRYLREPDLPEITLSTFQKEIGLIPELPEEKKRRYLKEYNLRLETIGNIISTPESAKFFEESVKHLENKKLIETLGNYFTSDLLGAMRTAGTSFGELPFEPKSFAQVINLIGQTKLGSRGAKDILLIMVKKGGDPEAIMKEGGYEQVLDDFFMEALIKRIEEENPRAMSEMRSGNQPVIQFLVGQAMKISEGKVNPIIFKKCLKNKISRGD